MSRKYSRRKSSSRKPIPGLAANCGAACLLWACPKEQPAFRRASHIWGILQAAISRLFLPLRGLVSRLLGGFPEEDERLIRSLRGGREREYRGEHFLRLTRMHRCITKGNERSSDFCNTMPILFEREVGNTPRSLPEGNLNRQDRWRRIASRSYTGTRGPVNGCIISTHPCPTVAFIGNA